MLSRGKSRVSNPSPVAGLLAGFLFLAVGAGVMWAGWRWVLSKTLEVRSWAVVPCEVTDWRVGIAPGSPEVYRATLALAYVYRINGQDHTGTVLNAAWSSLPGLNDLEEQGAAARRGGQVCYVNPQNPAEASLQQGSWLWPGAIMGFGLLFALIGGAVMLGSAGSFFRRITGRPEAVAASGRKGCLGQIMAPLFCLVFAGTGFAVWKFVIRNEPDWKKIGPAMRELPAKIIASGVERHTSSGRSSGTTYKAKVAFSYEFQDRTWHSGWLDFDRASSSSSNRTLAEEAAARHPAGQSGVCWVNPEAPWQAVLERERGSSAWLWIFPLIFGGFGAAGFLLWLSGVIRRFRRAVAGG